jgi:VanZ family protein
MVMPVIGKWGIVIAAFLISILGLIAAIRYTASRWSASDRILEQSAIHPSLPGVFRLSAIIMAVLAIYGSLVPLNYHPKPIAETWQQFLKTPYLQIDIYHLADWVANVLLFIPASYCALTAMIVSGRSMALKTLSFFSVWAAGVALALAIEFLQLWFPPRTVSQNDILAESIGTGIGCLLAATTAKGLACWLTRVLTSVRPIQVFDAALQCYAVGFLVYAVMPLDFIASPQLLAEKWKSERITWIWPGAPHLNFVQALGLLADAAAALPFGLWIGRRFGQVGKDSLAGMILACVFCAFFVEGMQVFVFSRYSSLSAVVFTAFGMAVGTQAVPLIGSQFNNWWATPATFSRRYAVTLLAGGYSFGLFLLLAQPQKWNSHVLVDERLKDYWIPPFSALYWGSEFHALTQIGQSVLLFMPLGFALADLCFVSASRSRTIGRSVLMFCLLGVFATAVELSQVWIPAATIDNTSTLAYISGGLIGYLLRNALGELGAQEGRTNSASGLHLHTTWWLGLAGTSAVAVILTFLTVHEAVAWNSTARVPISDSVTMKLEEDRQSDSRRSVSQWTRLIDPDKTAVRVSRIMLPDFDGANAIWGSSGRDDRGRIWFGVSAAKAPRASARLMQFDPGSQRVQEIGSVVSELRRLGLQRPDDAQSKIHSRIVQAADGFLYFTSMDEQGEADDGSSLPTYGSHLWRVHSDRPQFQHLASVPEGLIAIAASGRYIYSLGLFDHVLYQFDTQTSELRQTSVGSVGGHISRNFVADGRGHAYVPRLKCSERQGEFPPGGPLATSAGVSVTLVEYDESLKECAEWPLEHYLTDSRWTSHGITAHCQLSNGSILFVTSVGYLYRIDPGIDSTPGNLSPLGWVHPEGSAYTASMFCTDGSRQLLCISKNQENTYDYVCYDLETRSRSAFPLELPSNIGTTTALLYGSMTRDNSGAFYFVGTEYGHPLLLRAELITAFDKSNF